jgi:hypothetical protein
LGTPIFLQHEVVLAQVRYNRAVFVSHGGEDIDDFDLDTNLRRLGLLLGAQGTGREKQGNHRESPPTWLADSLAFGLSGFHEVTLLQKASLNFNGSYTSGNHRDSGMLLAVALQSTDWVAPGSRRRLL